jgi:hypothetical protein
VGALARYNSFHCQIDGLGMGVYHHWCFRICMDGTLDILLQKPHHHHKVNEHELTYINQDQEDLPMKNFFQKKYLLSKNVSAIDRLGHLPLENL